MTPSIHQKHEQVWVKVNAQVDRAVAGVIAALSEFPGLETIESCQGDGTGPAWLCFAYGSQWEKEWRAAAEFVLGFLAPGLHAEIAGAAELTLNRRRAGWVMVEMNVCADSLGATEKALRKLARRFRKLHGARPLSGETR